MRPSDAGAAGAPAPAPAGRSGPTRATPVVLLALAGVLLVLRVALGIYEGVRPAEPAKGSASPGAMRDSTFGAPNRGP